LAGSGKTRLGEFFIHPARKAWLRILVGFLARVKSGHLYTGQDWIACGENQQRGFANSGRENF